MDVNKLSATGPVQPGERVEVLDVIRGFALLGILIANMAFFSSPAVYLELLGREMWTSSWDRAVSAFIGLFIEGKFYTMFSFLFGLGFVIFFERAQAKSISPTLLFYRRLFILLLIGLVHAFFIWYGDILVYYALLGFFLPFFFKRSPKAILIWAVSFFLVLILIMTLLVVSMGMLDEVSHETFMQAYFADIENRLESSFYAYGQGTFAEIMSQRVDDVLFMYGQFPFQALLILPLFLLGLYVGKRGILQDIEGNMPFIKKVWMWGFIIGFPMSIIAYISRIQIDPAFASGYDLLHVSTMILANTGLSMFYVTSIVLLYQNREWILRLKPLAYVGRMALTNYLLQSIICVMIFYSFGLGLYGQVSPAWGLALTIVIFTVQVFISRYWLERYRFGPMEWVWRSLTYGKLSKMN